MVTTFFFIKCEIFVVTIVIYHIFFGAVSWENETMFELTNAGECERFEYELCENYVVNSQYFLLG